SVFPCRNAGVCRRWSALASREPMNGMRAICCNRWASKERVVTTRWSRPISARPSSTLKRLGRRSGEETRTLAVMNRKPFRRTRSCGGSRHIHELQVPQRGFFQREIFQNVAARRVSVLAGRVPEFVPTERKFRNIREAQPAPLIPIGHGRDGLE